MEKPVKTKKSALVKTVIRVNDNGFEKAIWVRMQYTEEAENAKKIILHDVAFMPNGKNLVFIYYRYTDNFIPSKRYMKMAKKAAAIIYDKK